MIAFDLGFLVFIIRSDKVNVQPTRKAFVLLGCEGGKYRKYKYDVHSSIIDTRKCECN